MSSPAQAGPSVPKEKKGVGRLLSRVKTVLKRADPSKRLSAGPKAGPSTVPGPTKPVAAPATSAAKPEPPPFEGQRIPRSQIHEERARKLAEKFGLEIKPSEWHSTEGDALRVEKPIRMRVHRRCHNCQASFGAAKECPGCGHVRCKQCTRAPPRRTEAEKVASRERRAALLKEREENAPIIPDWDPSPKKIVLTRPGKPGGQQLVHKKPRQRVRRTCHQCQKLFQSGNKTCSNCGHNRCTDCPRDPAKKDKYPYGYPGDEFGPNSTPYYSCHECGTRYPPNPDEGAECGKCSHRRCGDCGRLRPQRVEPEPDPELLKSLERKLEALRLQ